MSRARFLRLAGAAALGLAAPRVPAAPGLLTRPIPADGAPLPVIGCGTYIGFDVARPSAEYDALGEVVRTLFAAGGTVLDSSPMYGRAEAMTGRLLAEAGLRHTRHRAGRPYARQPGRRHGRPAAAGILERQALAPRPATPARRLQRAGAPRHSHTRSSGARSSGTSKRKGSARAPAPKCTSTRK